MKKSVKVGFGFGLTSGILTTLGLLIGLNAGTHSKIVVIGGILIIAIADALSDAFGIHISQEATKTKQRKIWAATFSTFFFKLAFALTFVVPIIFLELTAAVIVSTAWGLLLLCIFSYIIAKQRKESTFVAITEHLSIALVVIVVTYFVGTWVSTFG